MYTLVPLYPTMANMNRILSSIFILSLLGLSACDSQLPESAPQPSTEQSAVLSYTQGLTTVSGFHTGALVSAHKVYVFFDMQCPHCGHLWESAKQAPSSIDFVWVPVELLSPASKEQGALILGSPEAAKMMDVHEASLLAHNGGVTVIGAVIEDKARNQVTENTRVLRAFGITSVPFILSTGSKGQFVTETGALSVEQLTAFLDR
jgi:thiol:disulfide interchange protein DsbG